MHENIWSITRLFKTSSPCSSLFPAILETILERTRQWKVGHPLRHSPIPSIPMSALKTDVGLSVARLNAAKVYEANLPRWRNGKHTVN